MDDTLLHQRIGQRIRAARRSADLTQDQLAQQVGLKRSSIANLEAGRQDMSISRLAVIAALVNLNLADLVQPDDLPGLRMPLSPPHVVTLRRAWEVTCETCAPGQPFEVAAGYRAAVAARRDHIAGMREGRT